MIFPDDIISHVFGTSEAMRTLCSKNPLTAFLSALFRGIGQVIFVDNPLGGIAILVGLFLNDWRCALCGLLAGTIGLSTILATRPGAAIQLISSKPNAMNSGIYVYNAVLVGLAIPTFLPPFSVAKDALVVICIVSLASYVCTAIHVALERTFPGVPVLTFPFNIATTLFLPALRKGSIWTRFTQAAPTPPVMVWGVGNFFLGILRSPGQVYLAGDWKAGMLVIIAVTLWNWRAALLCVFGSALGTATALSFGFPLAEIYSGLYGYNACIIVMAVCHVFYPTNVKNSTGAILSSYLSVPLQLCLVSVLPSLTIIHYGVKHDADCPALTWPFCLCVLFYIILVERPGAAAKDDAELSETVKSAGPESPPDSAGASREPSRAGVAAEDHKIEIVA